MEYIGVPERLTLLNIFGAWPFLARPYIARLDVYRSDDPADHAEVKKQAFKIEGKDLIPAIWIAITHADDAAVPVEVVRFGLS